MTDVSLHVETLGCGPTAPVISIAAVQFDRFTGKLGAEFYQEVELNSVLRNKAFEVDAVAMRWWMDQTPGRRRVFMSNDLKKTDVTEYSLATVLDQFASWERGLAGPCTTWGNRKHSSDLGVLHYAYLHGAVGLQPPFGATNVRDVATVIDLAQAKGSGFVIPNPRAIAGKAGGLVEAINQVDVLCAALGVVLGAVVKQAGKTKLAKTAPVDEDQDPL